MNDMKYREFPEKVLTVLEVLETRGFEYQVRSFEAPAHHAREAADLLDCPIGAIVKSLVFRIKDQEKYVLVLVSGQNRADRNKLSKFVGGKVVPAKPGKVLSITGYPVGAVPPFGLKADLPVIIDEDLMAFEALWASGGSAFTLVNFESGIIEKVTGGRIYDIKKI